ncbi:MAG: Ig-like domain-containing protein [Geobacteraceae bacterium]|nr:Ig-like domain-containing protein [Geobacteraceae bacterium]
MIKQFWSCFIIMLALSGCGWDGSPTRNNDFIPLTSIEITAVNQTIAAKTSTKLTVTGNFSGLFTRDITDQATWSSNAANVADFVNAGLPSRVTGLTPGNTVLTATVGGVSSTFNLTVSNATITTVTVTPAAPSISKGLSTQFSASGTFSDATTQDLTFDATWASTAPAVATVSDAVASKGLVQTLTVGTSTISATFDGVSGSTLLTVTTPALQSIAVSTTNSSVLSLSGATFKATGSYSDGSTADITAQATWSSSNTGVATIAAGGTARTLSQGTTTISASLDGISGTANLKVTGGNLTGIVISPANFTLVQSTADRLTATGSFSNGTSREITGAVEWSTASATIATVATPGGNLAWVSALAVTPAATPTTISAKSGTLTATTNLTVTAPALQALTISPATMDLTVGTSKYFKVTASFNNGSTQDVTTDSSWSSTVATRATAGDIGITKGRISGIAAGQTTISAGYGGLTITAPVTVTARTLQSLALNQTGIYNVTAGNQLTFTATANYSDSTSQDVTEDTTWSIDKPGVAILTDSVNQPGQAVGVDSGSAILTATFGGKTQTVTIKVP